ncbi:hypothetical protein RJ639_006538 [Escallonia herrerae]|uniref:Retrotransposon gag domain-containing protein n=1 Tax=Escallonia herrerae TaxID=1293975 RepID=A0AA89AVQ4_9ASTE|nr:hypothetical protein RJ639_006538 [Escallonia herrerae]
MTNIASPIVGNQADLMVVIHAMQQSIERLQAVIENPPPRSEPPRPPGTSKTPEQTSHNQHVTQTEDEESDGERQNPRSRRHEQNYYEAHSARNTYANTGGNQAKHYSNAPIIIGRPFTEEIDLFPTPPNKMPPCESYDGTGDPMEHLARFTSRMNLHLVPDQIMCRAFPVTLKGATQVWFQHLAPRSISCWAQLAESFRSNFLTSRVQRKNSSALFHIIEGPKESLKSYYACFNSKKLLIYHLDPGVTFTAMARGVRPGTPLQFSLNKRPSENMLDLLDRVEKYLRAEEDSTSSHQEEILSGQKRQDHPEGKNQDETKPEETLSIDDKRDETTARRAEPVGALIHILAMAKSVVSVVLVQEEAARQLPIYYVSKIEVTNRTLLQGIKKKLDGVKGLWVVELPKILWAYNTTTRTPTSETPFSLSFGTEALIPIEIGLPSLRLMTYDPIQNAEALRANLDLLDERREQAVMRLAAYQHRVSKFYDQRVRP